MKLSQHRFLESTNGETRMPNHTHNEVLIGTNTNGEQEILALQILKNDLGIKDGQFDFNGIIPMPKEMRIRSLIPYGKKETKDHELVNGKYVPKDQKIRDKLVIKYGSDNWYDWACDHWGTKWNAYDVEISQDHESTLQVDFLTAWDSPREIVEKIFDYCRRYNLYLDWSAHHEGEEGFEQVRLLK